MKLAGSYGLKRTDPVRGPEAKEAFRRDSVNYLRAVLARLGPGWEALQRPARGKTARRGAIIWNSGGPGVGGECQLSAAPVGSLLGIEVVVCASCNNQRAPGGIGLYWRTADLSAPSTSYGPNVTPAWDTDSDELTTALRAAVLGHAAAPGNLPLPSQSGLFGE